MNQRFLYYIDKESLRNNNCINLGKEKTNKYHSLSSLIVDLNSLLWGPHLSAAQMMEPALEAILGQSSAHSLATGPVTADPFISPLGFTITPALSSKYRQQPSRLRKAFLQRMKTAGSTFLRRSGLPFLTEQRNMSPTEPRGNLFKQPPVAVTEITNRAFAPVLSAQLMTAAVGIPAEIFSLVPLLPPLPKQAHVKNQVIPKGSHYYLSCSSQLIFLINNKSDYFLLLILKYFLIL